MLRLLLFGLWLSVLGCAHGPNAPGGSRADASFEALVREYISGYLRWHPQAGTQAGLHEYDGQIRDLSGPAIRGELKRLKEFEHRLATLPATELSPVSAYDYRILQATIQRQIFTFETLRAFARNPMVYPSELSVDTYIKRDFAPLEKRFRSVEKVLAQAPRLFANARANLEPNLPRPQVEVAIEMANGLADFLEKDITLAVRDLANPRFNSVRDRAVLELREYAVWLKREKLPVATGNYALGPGNYARLLLVGELIDVSPDALLQLGMEELRKTQAAFAATARSIEPGKPAIEVFKAIQKDHPTAEHLIPDTTRNLESIRQFLLDKNIITLPSEVRAKVKETPQFLRATSFASMDTPGPFERKAAEAYYYVTPVEPEWSAVQKEEWLTAFNFYTTDVVSIHEAYPGHYTQFLCLNASKASRLEKLFPSYAFVEGWAHYTEQMMIENGFGGGAGSDASLKAAKYHLAQLDEALLRLCRMCVSIQMHCRGMTVEEATRFFQDNCYYEQKPARAEAVRGAYDPEYLYYTLGKLQFLKLREDYQRQEGERFSLKKFHDTVLAHGAPPLRLLREKLLKDPSTWPKTL